MNTELSLNHAATAAPTATSDPNNPEQAARTKESGARTNNTLTLKERVALLTWMDTPEHRAFVAKESDNDAAALATQDLDALGHTFDVTHANIASIRKTLGIEKLKAAKPAPVPQVDLSALMERVQRHGAMIHDASVDARCMQDAITQLRARVDDLEKRLASLEASND